MRQYLRYNSAERDHGIDAGKDGCCHADLAHTVVLKSSGPENPCHFILQSGLTHPQACHLISLEHKHPAKSLGTWNQPPYSVTKLSNSQSTEARQLQTPSGVGKGNSTKSAQSNLFLISWGKKIIWKMGKISQQNNEYKINHKKFTTSAKTRH